MYLNIKVVNNYDDDNRRRTGSSGVLKKANENRLY